MSVRKLDEIQSVEGKEGTKIRQIFHPHNTLNGIRFSLSHSTLLSKKKSARHKMKTSEIYYILEGRGTLYVDNEPYPVSKDEAVFIPPLSEQFIENTGEGELKFLCMVDPAWRKEDEILLD